MGIEPDDMLGPVRYVPTNLVSAIAYLSKLRYNASINNPIMTGYP